MGISDRDSWLLREAYPSGHASGWRRTGCFIMLIGALILVVLAAVIALLA